MAYNLNRKQDVTFVTILDRIWQDVFNPNVSKQAKRSGVIGNKLGGKEAEDWLVYILFGTVRNKYETSVI